MRTLLIFIYILLSSIITNAQSVAINTDGSIANSSALLDIKSTTKGMLVPRMTTAQRTAIASPATGLLVYDTDANSFWFYNGTNWADLSGNGGGGGNSSFWNQNADDIYSINAGKVGIGTNSPAKKFSVNGSILLDQNNLNYGVLDSAALRFGTNSFVGISSSRTESSINKDGLDLWTNGQRRISISHSGNVGIAKNNPLFALDVSGTINTSSSIIANNNIVSGINVTAGGSITAGNGVYGNYLNINEKAYIGSGMGIGTPVSNYSLDVVGSVRMQDNIRIDGTLNPNNPLTVGGKITNEGKGIVLSNTSATLRCGFNYGAFTISLAPGAYVDIKFYITKFSGDNTNAKVSISQFVPGTNASNWGSVNMTVHSVVATDPNSPSNSSCYIRFQNTGSSTANLGTNAVLHLMTMVTN